MWNGHVVIPAAGIAARMSPLSRYIPKCLLPLGDRPLLVHHLEKLESLGVQHVTLVLEPMLGSMIELAVIRGYSGRMWVKFIYQDRSLGRGPGYALNLCRDFVGAPLLVVLPDEWRMNERFAYTVIHDPGELVGQGEIDAAVAIARFSPRDLTLIGNVQVDPTSRDVTRLLGKPRIEDVAGEWGTCGGWAFFDTEKLFRCLQSLSSDPQNGELFMSTVLQRMIDAGCRIRSFAEKDNRQFHFTTPPRFWQEGSEWHDE